MFEAHCLLCSTGGCHNNNFRCQRWRQILHHDNSHFSALTVPWFKSDNSVEIATACSAALFNRNHSARGCSRDKTIKYYRNWRGGCCGSHHKPGSVVGDQIAWVISRWQWRMSWRRSARVSEVSLRPTDDANRDVLTRRRERYQDAKVSSLKYSSWKEIVTKTVTA